jgi:hypothetical protein
MRYRLKCLTPLLVGDGRKLSPIDYMVWKDHVNVLDQWRIFRLLAKGPRLEGYLAQLKRADKLDFASWGGFAQNFAGRRIPFENAAYSTYWNRAAGESLHIPTFATGAAGPYLPAAAIKGALRTGMLFAHWRDGMLQDVLARVKSERTQRVPPRRPAEIVEEQALGPPGSNRIRFVSAGDSAPIATSRFQIYLLRPGFESALPQDPPHRVLEQQARHAAGLGGTQHRGVTVRGRRRAALSGRGSRKPVSGQSGGSRAIHFASLTPAQADCYDRARVSAVEAIEKRLGRKLRIPLQKSPAKSVPRKPPRTSGSTIRRTRHTQGGACLQESGLGPQ